jgi:hypothetical protein
MKTYKKIGLGLTLSLILFLLSLFVQAVLPRASALSCPANGPNCTINIGTDFKFTDSQHIVGTVDGNLITFYDKNPGDGKYNYAPQGLSKSYCNPSGSNGINDFYYSKGYWGIDLPPDTPALLKLPYPISGKLLLGFSYTNGNATKCGVLTNANNSNVSVSNAGASQDSYTYSNKNIITSDGKTTYTGTTTATNNGNIYIDNTKAGSCEASGLIVTDSVGAGSGTLYSLGNGKQVGRVPPSGDPVPDSIGQYLKTPSNCRLLGTKTIDITGDLGSQPPGSSCTGGAGCNGGICTDPSLGCTTGTPPPTQASSCESAGSTGLEWILCPVLRIFDSMINTFTGILENLLDFDVSTYLNPQVKSSWNIIKNIASALLIIIMLIAIIAQAVGGGPIDAYTLRKILPRLVIAVILIQISWFMLIWVINVANDVGYGVRDLITAPFGGWGKLDLNHLIAPLSDSGQITLAALFTGLVAAVWISGITIGGVALLGISAVASDLLAFVFLLLRQVFIILSVILFPIALIAWILPGTQRYWKLWWDNFIKLLFLFPMIMVLIYGGRIFAHIFVLANTGTAIGKVISLFVLFIGFFGPYWFIPKAFKWGGQLYASASSGAFNATKGLRNAPKQFGLAQAKANRAQRATDRNERLSYGRGRRFDRLWAAAGGLGLSDRATRTRQSRQRAEGREAGEKAVAQDILASPYEGQDHGKKLESLDLLAQGEFDPATGLSGDNPAMQRWALDQLATFGDWDRIDGLRTNNKIDERTWQAFVAKNIGPIHQNAPYLSPIRRDMSALGYQEYGTWKDHSFHEYERQIMNGQVRTADGKGWEYHKDPGRQKQLAIDNARRALDDERVRANLSADAVTVLERIRDMDSPEVGVTTRQGSRIPDVHVPTGSTLHNNPQASNNLRAALLKPTPAGSNDPQKGLIIKEVATRLANPNVADDDPDKLGIKDFLLQLKQQAVSSGSPDAKAAYNQTMQAVAAKLKELGPEAERQALAQGQQGPDVIQARAAAEAAADAEWQRLQQNFQLTLLP